MNHKILGHNIGTLRRQCGMTQKELAEKAGVSRQHISSIETGYSSLSLLLMYKICNILDVTPNDVLAGEFEPKNGKFYSMITDLVTKVT